MKLITKKLERRFKKVGYQGENLDPLVITKFFGGNYTWYATEYYPKRRVFFGFIYNEAKNEGKWGYFSPEKTKITFSLILNDKEYSYMGDVERDLWFDEKPFSKLSLEQN